jgi:hypothetical protein
MASTYSSIHIYPGRRAGNIKKIINYVCNNNTTETIIQTPFIITSGSPIIENNNDYYTIKFLSNGSIQFLVPLTVANNDFYALVVGGGGGGGKSSSNLTNGGGGGAGGEVIYTALSVSQNINYNVIVGQGGLPNGLGNKSSFSSIVSNGGNVGNDATNSTSGTGGLGVNGGGSGGDGGTYFSSVAATNGKNGTPITINSTINYYGGGGGGGSYNQQASSSIGGLGGGGGGGFNTDIATPNTGGGGGGGNGNGVFQTYGGPGGSGIVILNFRYIKKVVTSLQDDCKVCLCPSPINSKIIKNSNPDVIPLSTQTARIVTAIRYARGGTTVYGNAAYNSSGDATLLGRVEGGYEAPIKNKF